jgi:hypothetical protein
LTSSGGMVIESLFLHAARFSTLTSIAGHS